ncbi:MAG TPA: PKD domain-containing protein [Flavobacteriales bacterium]|nr:PKD domain-containing protein [Flavobacteriales bacterium]
MMKKICTIISLLYFGVTYATIWSVGPAQTFTKPSDVVGLVSNGDTIEIHADTYLGDFCIWSQNSLYFIGVGGYAHLDASGFTIPNQKAIWVIDGDDNVIENIEFSGASVPDKNGAGIRMQGTNLTIKHCYFHDNEDGILAGDNSNSDILIEYSVFSNNGYGDGLSHNMYINHINSFTLQHCYSHNANVGHTVKTRAHNNYILYNRIMDEGSGNASHLIDIPNGGKSFIIGNLVHQGPSATNGSVISYGNEGLTNPNPELYVINNTMVNERNYCYDFVKIASGTAMAKLFNNLFVDTLGSAVDCQITSYTGSLDTVSNILTDDPNVINLSGYDYGLMSSSIAIDAGTDPGFAGTYALLPQYEYLHTADLTLRNTSGAAIDIGAYEYIFPPCPFPMAGFSYSANGLSVVFNDSSIVTGNATYTWDFGDGSALSNQQSYTYSVSGTYNVCLAVTDSCGTDTICQDVVVTDSIAGILTDSERQTINVYPNPVEDVLYFKWVSKTRLVINIYDSMGRLIQCFDLDEEYRVSADKYLEGIYFYRGLEKNGTQVLNGSFVVSR